MGKTKKVLADPPKPVTLEQFIEQLRPGTLSEQIVPDWPPDVFGVVSAVLARSGGYRRAIMQWPPDKDWVRRVRHIAHLWRTAWNRQRRPPTAVRSWWQDLLNHRQVLLEDIVHDQELCVTLLSLSAAADEASASAGIPAEKKGIDNFDARCDELLLKTVDSPHGSTLCQTLHQSRVRVLPKMHTPQSGLTSRSFSHHLAFCISDEMEPKWNLARVKTASEKLTLLVIPWPFTVQSSQFRRVPPQKCELRMPPQFGFFEYEPRVGDVISETERLISKATKRYGPVDGVILPELAVTDTEYRLLSGRILARCDFLVCGVRTHTNEVKFDVRKESGTLSLWQMKHHRWRLDGSQIRAYGIHTQLDPQKHWWEHIPLKDRRLLFVAMRPWLTISVLVCEDLARPDPVGNLLRAVGPNLVIALLMDGPQLESRWSSRCAAALADDPGCSVLSLTSLGMAQRFSPAWLRKPSRIVGLWRDGVGGRPTQIELPKSATAAVLRVKNAAKEEFTADGRGDGGNTGCPVLIGRPNYL